MKIGEEYIPNEIWDKLYDIFTLDNAVLWYERKNSHLNSKTPKEIVESGQAKEVLDLLIRMEREHFA